MSTRLLTLAILAILATASDAVAVTASPQPAMAQSAASSEAPMFIGGRRRGRRGARAAYYNRMAQQQAKAEALAQRQEQQAINTAHDQNVKSNAAHARTMSNYKTGDFIKQYR